MKKVHDEVDDVDVDEEEIIEEKANNLTNDNCQYAENDAVTPITSGDDEPEKNCDFGKSPRKTNLIIRVRCLLHVSVICTHTFVRTMLGCSSFHFHTQRVTIFELCFCIIRVMRQTST